jgi:BirA family transcriptional regulator, biotin operon repressor / biotin---[acetyl-CoA-carboxylase] ligase
MAFSSMASNSMAFDLATFDQALVWGQDRFNLPKTPAHLVWLETTDSTNRHLWSLLDAGSSLSTVVIAATQTQGKGQYGRNWNSSLGGLYLSMPIPTSQAQSNAPTPTQMTLSTAWAMAEVLNQSGLPVQIKWLNDLVINGLKFGGILTEARWRGDRLRGAIVGIGLNVTNPLPDQGISLRTLHQSQATLKGSANPPHFFQNVPGQAISWVEKLAGLTVAAVHLGTQQFINLDVLAHAYETYLSNLHKTVQIDDRQGIIVGVNTEGNLRVRIMSKGTDESIISQEEIYLPPGTIRLGYG